METCNLDHEKLKRYFNGKYSDKDASYIDKVFCDDTAEGALKLFLSEQFNELLPEDELQQKNLDHILYKIHFNINTKQKEKKPASFDYYIKWAYRIAGIIILPLVVWLGLHLYKTSLISDNYWVEIKAPAWTRAQFSLPDGTTGWLNSNSSVKYNGSFDVNREVTLTGEAFFDVFKDKGRPFVVNTKEVNLKVVGTRFNIASYENENNVEVVLEEGKLVFKDKAMKKSYAMKPNDMVVYDKEGKKFSTTTVQSRKYTSWTEGKLVFRNDPIDVIARRLERWYNVVVTINGPASEDIRWRATFVDEDLEKVLEFLKRSLPVDYKIENPAANSDGVYNKKKVTIILK